MKRSSEDQIEAMSEVVLQLAKDKPNSQAFRSAVVALVDITKEETRTCVRVIPPAESAGQISGLEQSDESMGEPPDAAAGNEARSVKRGS